MSRSTQVGKGHRRRTPHLNWMLRTGASVKSDTHSMLTTCCTCAPPSTVGSTGLVCRFRCENIKESKQAGRMGPAQPPTMDSSGVPYTSPCQPVLPPFNMSQGPDHPQSYVSGYSLSLKDLRSCPLAAYWPWHCRTKLWNSVMTPAVLSRSHAD